MAKFPFKYIMISLLGLPFFACANSTAVGSNVSEAELAAYVMQLNNAPLHSMSADLDLWGKIRHRFELEETRPELIQRFEKFYATKPEYFNRIVRRGSPYLYHIASEVEKRGMPGEIALLPFIESAFVTRAKSHVGASGIWQFMPKTGIQYGLKQSQWYDGRNDVHAATDAALDYLQYLHGMFDDWQLALAAYNCGEGCVQRAQIRAKKKGLPTTFENLDLPRETREYVPKLLAVRNLIEDPSAFDLTLNQIDNRPYFEAVKITHPMDIAVIARLAKISEEELMRLNPGYKVPVWVPQSGRKLLLPKSAVATFRANLRQADPDTLLNWQPYRVGEVRQLSEIAKQYGMTLADLKKSNNLSGDMVPTGSILLVMRVRSTQQQMPDSVITVNRTMQNHIVKTAYEANPTSGWYEEPRIINDTVVSSRTNHAVRYTQVKVKKGTTLSQIAQRAGMTVKELKALNNLRTNKLRVGQVLKIKGKSATSKRVTTRKVKQKTTVNKRVQNKANHRKASQKVTKISRKKRSA